MDKQQIISLIKGKLSSGAISKDDLLNIVNEGASNQNDSIRQMVSHTDTNVVKDVETEDTSKNLIHTFYGIGAIIAIVGVVILVAQNWNEIGFGGRLLVTLGISFATYVSGLLLRKAEQNTISQVMFTISAALAPLGVYVLLSEASVNFTSGTQFLIASALFILYGSAFVISKKNILFLITVAFATWAYFALFVNIFSQNFIYDGNLLKWATILLGVAYIFISYGYKFIFSSTEHSGLKEKKSTQDVLYGLGTLAILGAGIMLNGIYDLLFIALIFAAFYGSVYLRSRSMLIFGAIFLMAHIMKLTSQYFVDSIGWPVALIFVGFFVIGVGYMTFYLNNKFISGK